MQYIKYDTFTVQRSQNMSLCLLCCMFLPLQTFSQSKTINSGWQYSENKTQWETVNIPHTWNKIDAFDDAPGYRRGLGYYKKEVFVSASEKNKIHYLKFNAVNQEATVYINGKKVIHHKGGYTAFNVDVTSQLNFNAYNLIEVTVNNSHNINIPPLDADFTFFGGIYRDVEWISLPKQHFSLKDFASDGFYVDYHDVSKAQAGVKVKVMLDNFEEKITTNLKLQIFDAQNNLIQTQHRDLQLKATATKTIDIKFSKIKTPKLWSPSNPYLYRLELILTDKSGGNLDFKKADLGFRWTSIDSEKGFFLNGESIKLIGVNRHQDYKNYGFAVPLALQKKDIHLIKNMGANIVRFAHYPHSRELYKLCNELGLLVWTEIPIVNKVTDSDQFFEVATTMQREHIKQYYNYSSVVMIGYMNEIFLRLAFDNKSTASEKKALKKASVKLATQLEGLTRKLAPNHITVMACHLNELYNETGIADLPMLLGWNLYFGWYDATIEDLGKFLDNQYIRYPKRSLLLSEYGTGADVRIFTKQPKKFDFSTNYQEKLHQSYYKQIKDRPYMTGMTAWNFSDFSSEFRGDAMPHINQKGLVNYDRTPKDIYYWYQSVLKNNTPFIHIATNYLNQLTVFEDETYPVQIFSNEKKATIRLNDDLLGEYHFENSIITAEIQFKNGSNTITVVTENTSQKKAIIVNRIEALDFKNFDTFGINIGSHFNYFDPVQNLTFVPDQPYKKGWFGYTNGNAFGMTKDKNQGIPHNIKNTDADPLFQTLLEGCTTYKVNIPKGNYKVTLYFVEPQIKATENIYNLSEEKISSTIQQRIFDIYINDILIQEQVNLAKTYPGKYGVTISAKVKVSNNRGLSLVLNPVEGKPVISGILIEKLN